MVQVLVVEDDADVRGLISHRLNRGGHTVTQASSGEMALRLLQDQNYDLVTLDINLPGISGWDIAREISSRTEIAHIPIVVVSVLEQDEAPLDVIVEQWLTKPFTGSQLQRSIEGALASLECHERYGSEGS